MIKDATDSRKGNVLDCENLFANLKNNKYSKEIVAERDAEANGWKSCKD
jgi:hypothetical protein